MGIRIIRIATEETKIDSLFEREGLQFRILRDGSPLSRMKLRAGIAHPARRVAQAFGKHDARALARAA